MCNNNYTALDNMLQLRDIFLNIPDEDKIRASVEMFYNMLIHADAEAKIGAAPYERTASRTVKRNGFRHKPVTSSAGELDIEIPKLRKGSYFPDFLLKRRRRIDKAMCAVVMEAYTKGISTRKVDDLVKSLGNTASISKSEVSRMCGELDNAISVFQKRKLTSKYPYVYFDATYVKAREGEHVESAAVVIALAVRDDGFKEILGFDVGNTESEEFWSNFLTSLNERGLNGVKLVITDSHSGLKTAINKKLVGTSWQRCKVHFMRNIMAKIPKKQSGLIIPVIKTIFTATSKTEAYENFDKVLKIMQENCPDAADMLEDAKEDILAYLNFPQKHWKNISSSNLLERFNKEIKRRSNVIQIFPNKAAVRRLVGTMIIEQNDEWIAEEKRYISLESMNQLYEQERLKESAKTPELTAAKQDVI
jgi:transposase-like protein